MKSETKRIVLGIIAIVIVAVVGSICVNLGMDWFDGLTKPNEWINEILIPIVWTIIYILFAIYLFVAIKDNSINKKITILLILNGIINILWCLVFFALNNLLGGVAIIVINLMLAVLLVAEILKSSHKFINYALLIYPTWIMFATTLNVALWILN